TVRPRYRPTDGQRGPEEAVRRGSAVDSPWRLAHGRRGIPVSSLRMSFRGDGDVAGGGIGGASGGAVFFGRAGIQHVVHVRTDGDGGVSVFRVCVCGAAADLYVVSSRIEGVRRHQQSV